MMRSGVPILQSLDIVADTTGNVVLDRAVRDVQDSVREGESLAGPLAKHAVFPPMVVQMMAVGEDTGALDTMLQQDRRLLRPGGRGRRGLPHQLIEPILIAIAIPTFLGARTRAQNRAVQANLRNALTVEKSYYTDAQLYSSDVTATGPLKLGEPALTYVADGSMTAATAGNVYVSVPATNTVVLGTKSASGTCYYLKDITTGTGAGTFYLQDTTCAAPSATAASVTLARWTA